MASFQIPIFELIAILCGCDQKFWDWSMRRDYRLYELKRPIEPRRGYFIQENRLRSI
jgi:hypothetical protein